jgi:hypothetical protein
MNFQTLKQSKLIQTKEKEFLEFSGHRAKTGPGPRPTAAFAGQPTRRTACPVGTGGPLCVAHDPMRPACSTCTATGVCAGALLARLASGRVHTVRCRGAARSERPTAKTVARCSSMASWLPHAPARQEDASDRAPEQDDDMVACHTPF